MTGFTRDRGGLSLQGLVREFGEVRAVDGVSLDVEPGTLVSLLGPSGCGKSTLLRLVAGLESPDAGRVVIDGIDVTTHTPQARPTAMVFQSYALFPNMTVAGNVAYGLDVRRVPKKQRQARVRAALERVGLADLADRPVTRLSGGQQQRVAVARALAVEPRVLLFDEPLSNLDVALREKTRDEVRALQQGLGITALYVTHDQEEALAVSDRVAVLRRGSLVQVDRPEIIFERPATSYVARFLGGSNILDASTGARLTGEPAGPDQVLAVRPDELQFALKGTAAHIVSRRYLGTHIEWHLDLEGTAVRVHSTKAPDDATAVRVVASSWRWVRDDD